MKRASELAKEEAAMGTLLDITSVFEGIASMRIAQIKNQVLQATDFFNNLWKIYSQINVSGEFGFGREGSAQKLIDKELYILITAEGGLSGDIDQKLINFMLENYNKEKNEIIVIGHHGAIQLAQRGVSYKKYFKLPQKDANINVEPILREVQQYTSTIIYYQEYISLAVQDVKRIELSSAVKRQVLSAKPPDEVINESNYIFEHSTYAVVDHLERSMIQIAASQLILQSKLAQYASRFRAMNASHERSHEAKEELHLELNRSKRAIRDQRLKESVISLKLSRIGAAK